MPDASRRSNHVSNTDHRYTDSRWVNQRHPGGLVLGPALSFTRVLVSAYDLMCRSGYGLTCRGTAT
jgi:hypothetical protein